MRRAQKNRKAPRSNGVKDEKKCSPTLNRQVLYVEIEQPEKATPVGGDFPKWGAQNVKQENEPGKGA